MTNNLFSPDPNSIFSFIIDELQAAEDAGQRAWLFGHIPPGVSDWMLDQVRVEPRWKGQHAWGAKLATI
jgi:hypothetical protein